MSFVTDHTDPTDSPTQPDQGEPAMAYEPETTATAPSATDEPVPGASEPAPTALPGGLLVNKPGGSTVQDAVSEPVASSEEPRRYGPEDAVRVVSMGGRQRYIDYREGWNTTDYLREARISVNDRNTVVANGGSEDLNEPLEPASVIVVTGNIDNG